MTGYHPDFSFLEALGIRLTGKDRTPEFDAHTLESNVPGIYLAGVVVAAARTNEIFIENGRFHGAQIAAGLRQKLRTPVEKACKKILVQSMARRGRIAIEVLLQ